MKSKKTKYVIQLIYAVIKASTVNINGVHWLSLKYF